MAVRAESQADTVAGRFVKESLDAPMGVWPRRRRLSPPWFFDTA